MEPLLAHKRISSLITPLVSGPENTHVLRLDQLDPVLSGNKVFKLLGHLDAWEASGRRGLLSFGGAWSNHLHALAALASDRNIPVTGFVRAYAHQPLTATLEDCQQWGMNLRFCDRVTYAQRYDSGWHQALAEEYDAWVIPEGGEGPEGEQGWSCLQPILAAYREVWLAAGTGTTARGIAAMMPADSQLVVVNCVADRGALARRWSANPLPVRVTLLDTYHGGGFARADTGLMDLIRRYDQLGLPLDPVYTAKLMAAFEGESPDSTVPRLLIHTGGLQGRRGYGLEIR